MNLLDIACIVLYLLCWLRKSIQLYHLTKILCIPPPTHTRVHAFLKISFRFFNASKYGTAQRKNWKNSATINDTKRHKILIYHKWLRLHCLSYGRNYIVSHIVKIILGVLFINISIKFNSEKCYLLKTLHLEPCADSLLKDSFVLYISIYKNVNM